MERHRQILGHLGGHRVRVFSNGIQYGTSTENGKEKFHRQVLVEELVLREDHLIHTVVMKVRATLHRQHRK